jgi:hypothetical protein
VSERENIESSFQLFTVVIKSVALFKNSDYAFRAGGAFPPRWILISVPVAHVAADLFLITTAREVSNAHSRPAQLGHQLRQTSVGARCAAALGHLQRVSQRLAAHPFQAIKLDLAAHALQWGQPRIGGALDDQTRCS